jgi:hypothetical protein
MFDRRLKASFIARRAVASRLGRLARRGAGPGFERTAHVARREIVALLMQRPGVRRGWSPGQKPQVAGSAFIAHQPGRGQAGWGGGGNMLGTSVGMLRRAASAGLEAGCLRPAADRAGPQERILLRVGVAFRARVGSVDPRLPRENQGYSAWGAWAGPRFCLLREQSSSVPFAAMRRKDTNVHKAGQHGGDCGRFVGGSSGLGGSASRCRLCGGCGGRGSLGELHKRPLKRQKR